jgi:hypothetical protein
LVDDGGFSVGRRGFGSAQLARAALGLLELFAHKEKGIFADNNLRFDSKKTGHNHNGEQPGHRHSVQ